MGHYWKIKCPVCGAETMSSKEEGLKVECSHFGRFVPEQSLVIYYNIGGNPVSSRRASLLYYVSIARRNRACTMGTFFT